MTSGSPATSVPWWAEPPSGRPDLACGLSSAGTLGLTGEEWNALPT
jgi:hypothetical protein